LIRNCARPTTVPITNEVNEQTSNNACHTLTVTSPSVSPTPSVNECRVNNSTIIEILGITASHVVTIVGTPSYTSGAQLWNGAEAILNRNPTVMITSPRITPCVTLSDETDTRLLIASRLVNPVYP
jgi:hypothetical protein